MIRSAGCIAENKLFRMFNPIVLNPVISLEAEKSTFFVSADVKVER